MKIPKFEAQTEWVKPTEFPDLRKVDEIAIDLETKDPGLKERGSGSVIGDGDVVGIISERDYLGKVSFMNKKAEDTKISEVCTYGAVNLVSVTLDNPIDQCMRKMLDRNVRHLLIREKETGNQSIN